MNIEHPIWTRRDADLVSVCAGTGDHADDILRMTLRPSGLVRWSADGGRTWHATREDAQP